MVYDQAGLPRTDCQKQSAREAVPAGKYIGQLEIKAINENQLAIKEKDFLEQKVTTTLDVVLKKL